jgi:polysaccharide export outer membrane protein
MTTVRQALAVAGGVTDRGSTRRVQVIRVIDDKEVTMDVDLQTPVQAGDTIVVNERFF